MLVNKFQYFTRNHLSATWSILTLTSLDKMEFIQLYKERESATTIDWQCLEGVGVQCLIESCILESKPGFWITLGEWIPGEWFHIDTPSKNFERCCAKMPRVLLALVGLTYDLIVSERFWRNRLFQACTLITDFMRVWNWQWRAWRNIWENEVIDSSVRRLVQLSLAYIGNKEKNIIDGKLWIY